MSDGMGRLKPATRWVLLIGISVTALSVTASLRPIPMPLAYHNFADQREMFGIANALDVLSNVPFFVVGVLGLYFALRRKSALNKEQRWACGTMFAGLILTGVGSAYYHLAPDNTRLVFDRLPMTVAMAGFISALVTDRFGRIGLRILPLIAAAGIASVLQWSLSEQQGRGDVRWYALYEGLAIITGVALLIMFPSLQKGTREFAIAVVGNIAAKLFELLDKPIFSMGDVVSGHTLKHLSAGLAFVPLVLMVARYIDDH
jgi:hypothetical protein